MRDAKLISQEEARLPDEWRRKYLARSVDRLPGDVTVAFDRLHTMEREKDKLRDDFGDSQRKLDFANIKIWILTSLVTAQFGLIAWLGKTLFDRLPK